MYLYMNVMYVYPINTKLVCMFFFVFGYKIGVHFKNKGNTPFNDESNNLAV